MEAGEIWSPPLSRQTHPIPLRNPTPRHPSLVGRVPDDRQHHLRRSSFSVCRSPRHSRPVVPSEARSSVYRHLRLALGVSVFLVVGVGGWACLTEIAGA